MSEFSASVPRHNTSLSFLPVYHTCDGIDFRRHIRGGQLNSTDLCEVFNERITYLFYGRPSYKFNSPNSSTRRLEAYPVCLIFDFELIPEIKRIYPFDSGAKFHNMLDDFIDKKLQLVDFEIEPETSRVTDVVLKFFGSNEAYLACQPSSDAIDPLQYEAQSYLEMLRALSGKADDRRATIEVQAGTTVPFSGGVLKGIVTPIQYESSSIFTEFREKLNIPSSTYEIALWHPMHAYGQLVTEAQKLARMLASKSLVG
jgi:hypothetical protein